MKPLVLSVDYLPNFLTDQLYASFDFHHELHKNDPAALEKLAPEARALVANGETILTGEMLARFPKAEIISVFGVGYDGIDVAAARARGIQVTHTPNVLTDDVADLAMALILTVSRRIIPADQHGAHSRLVAGRLPVQPQGQRQQDRHYRTGPYWQNHRQAC